MNGATCGTFDYLIHEGHILFLKKCKKVCDHLHVWVVSDEIIRRNKGRRAYYTAELRCRNLLETEFVSSVGVIEAHEWTEKVFYKQFDIYIFGNDQSTDFDIELQHILYRREVAFIQMFNPSIQSTTNLLKISGKWEGLI